MKTTLALSQQTVLRVCGWIAVSAMAASVLGAQTAVPRVTSEINPSERALLQGSRHPLAQPQFDAGRMPSDTRISGMSIRFNLSPGQQADLNVLIAAQQNPASPLYHQWITPEQYAARFGMAQADIEAVQNWLLQQGFSIDSVARSHNMIRFSGTVGQIESAFSTEMHYYNVGGRRNFAPNSDLQIPAALASVVLGVGNLNDFRPKPWVIPNKGHQPKPSFTSSQSGNVYFAPGDIYTAYDVNPLKGGGYTGTGQSIAVAGQSQITVSDIENFESAAGLPVKDPSLILVPGTGSSAVSSGDETESDLDTEWSGAMAPGADIDFVYTGSNTNYSVLDSMVYAVDQRIGDIITVSYGVCEPLAGSVSGLEQSWQQASTQGQTVIAASGDDGSTSCFVENPPKQGDPPLATQEELAVSYPASSPNVLAVGGTEITCSGSSNDPCYNSTYWETATSNTKDNINSAKSYIPEVAWNDDSSASGLSSGGGGKSTVFGKPSWQAALTPSDGARDVPDISLYASPNNPGYLYCTSDQSSWDTQDGQAASCNSGFRDSTSGLLTVAGGTSFAAPIFAGMLADLNQEKGYVAGAGQINSDVYALANSGGHYSAGSIFHDVTSGGNQCTAGSLYCSGSGGSEYAAGNGYDLATGLGSINLGNLASAWTASSSTLVATTTTVTASSSTPNTGTNVTFTITVVSADGSTTPSGSVNLSIDGGGTSYSSGGATTTASLTGSGGGTATATYTTSFSTAGTHQVLAQYKGDPSLAPSTGAASVTVNATSSGKGSFKISASPSTLTVAQGASGNETITITPAGGYTGTVYLTYDTSNDTALQNLCYNFTTTLNNGDGSVAISGAAPVTTTLNFDTQPSDCGLAQRHRGIPQQLHPLAPRTPAKGKIAKDNLPGTAPLGVLFAGLLIGFLGRRSRRFTTLAGVIALVGLGLAISACGGSGSGGGNNTTTTPEPATGTYTVTLTAKDSTSSTIPTATTTFTFVIN
jgi:subtilase family serine protease